MSINAGIEHADIQSFFDPPAELIERALRDRDFDRVRVSRSLTCGAAIPALSEFFGRLRRFKCAERDHYRNRVVAAGLPQARFGQILLPEDEGVQPFQARHHPFPALLVEMKNRPSQTGLSWRVRVPATVAATSVPCQATPGQSPML
jgi:hypothetical protein